MHRLDATPQVTAVVHAYQWRYVGWLLRLTGGNLLASAIWGPVGFALGAVYAHRQIVLPMRRHHRAMAVHRATLDAALGNLHHRLDAHDRALGITAPTQPPTEGES